MGKQLIQQRRGKGSVFKAPSHRFFADSKYKASGEGFIVDIIHDSARYCPLMVTKFKGVREFLIAPQGVRVGNKISYDGDAKVGNILSLEKIPEGTQICNIEIAPKDGGKICRSPGTFATVIGHEKDRCIITLPSKASKKLSNKCRATIGIVAGAGQKMKPFLKAGARFYGQKAKGRYYPVVSASAMNVVAHPFGGKTSPGKPRSISRHAPPGKKVGSISPKRTGRGK